MQIVFLSLTSPDVVKASHRTACLRGVYVAPGQHPNHFHFYSTLTVTLKVHFDDSLHTVHKG